MLFQVNHSEGNTGFDPVPVGTYEAIISKTEVTKSTTGGNPMIKVQLTIRDDVDQGSAKRKLFDNLVQSERAMFKFQQVAKAAQLADGIAIDTLEEFAAAILFKAVRVRVKHEDYKGEMKDRVAGYDVAKVEYKGSANGGAPDPFAVPGMADPFADDGRPIDISDDDLPF